MTTNGFYEATQIVEDALRNEGFLTIDFGREDQKELKRQTLFPYANFAPVSNTYATKTVTYTFQLSVYDLIDWDNDFEPTKNDTPTKRKDNLRDVLHDLDLRIRIMLDKLNRGYTQLEYSTTTSVIATPLIFEDKNVEAGYTFNVNITLPSASTTDGIC